MKVKRYWSKIDTYHCQIRQTSMDIMINRTYLTGKKIKGKNIAITENLTATRMKKLKEAREIYDFKNVWTSDGEILFKDGSGNAIPFCD